MTARAACLPRSVRTYSLILEERRSNLQNIRLLLLNSHSRQVISQQCAYLRRSTNRARRRYRPVVQQRHISRAEPQHISFLVEIAVLAIDVVVVSGAIRGIPENRVGGLFLAVDAGMVLVGAVATGRSGLENRITYMDRQSVSVWSAADGQLFSEMMESEIRRT